MATPFDLASELYYHTATNSALQDLGRQGEINAQRAFELRAQQNRAQLESRNRIGEIQAESSARGQLAATEAARVKNEGYLQKVAQAQQIDPTFKPDPDKSIDQNMAAADRVGYNKTVSNLKASTDNVNKLWGQARGTIDAQGKPVAIDPKELNRKIIDDPSMVGILDRGDIERLNEGMSPEQLASNFWRNKNKSALLAAAQTARQALAAQQAQKNASDLNLTLAELNSKASAASDVHGRIVQSLPPDLQSEVLAYGTKIGYESPTPIVPTPPAGVNPGVLGQLQGGQGNPPPPAATPATDAQIPPPIVPTPGLDPSLDPATYRNLGRINATDIRLNKAQTELSQKETRFNFLDQLLTKGTTDTPQTPVYAQWAAALAPRREGKLAVTPEEGELYANEHDQLFNQIPKLRQKVNELQALKQSLAPAYIAPSGPQYPNAPGQQQRFNMAWPPSGVNQPQTSQPPITQPSAMNGANGGNAFQAMAARNQLQQIFGTSDPNILNAVKNLAKSQGATDDQLTQAAQAAVNGDPQAIAQARQMVAMVTQQNNGQIAAMPQGQQSYQPMGFSA